MNEESKVPAKGSDWTRLLTDPDLVSHLGKLLQTYRDVPADQREAALLGAMREIKDAAIKARSLETPPEIPALPTPEVSLHSPEPATDPPPFEPESAELSSLQDESLEDDHSEVQDLQKDASEDASEEDPFESQSEADRRRFQRLKCYVAVEIHVEGTEKPVWGNLSNVGRGGCLVETATMISPGKALEIGLWVASGKIWVKGVMISGVASASSMGVRVKFSQSELSEKEHLREFLKFVEGAARKSQSGNAYVAQLKTQ